jgi:hypothetical protein
MYDRRPPDLHDQLHGGMYRELGRAGGCATRCSEAEGVKTIKMLIQDASSREIGNFLRSREFLKLFKQK